MRAAGEIADWWDKQRKESSKFLEDFVEENPGLFGVVLATAVETSMDLGGGLVDVLRLGEGAAEGGLSGFGKDGLRVLQVIPVFGKVGSAARSVESLAASQSARLGAALSKPIKLSQALTDIAGPNCAWVAAARSSVASGQRLWASLDDLAKAAGESVAKMKGMTAAQIRTLLTRIGVKVGPAIPVDAIEEIARHLPRDGSVGIVGVAGRVTKEAKLAARQLGGEMGDEGGHALMVFWDELGELRFMERDGRIFASLDELVAKSGVWENLWAESVQVVRGAKPLATRAQRAGKAVADAAIKAGRTKLFDLSVVRNLNVRVVNGIGVLAMELRAVALADADTVAQAYEVYREKKTKGAAWWEGLEHYRPDPAKMTAEQAANVEKIRAVLGPKAKGGTDDDSLRKARGGTDDDSLRKAKGRAKAGDGSIKPAAGGTYAVRRGDSLSKIALAAYGDMHKWPVIWIANKELVGPNPDLIHPGMPLKIPTLPAS